MELLLLHTFSLLILCLQSYPALHKQLHPLLPLPPLHLWWLHPLLRVCPYICFQLISRWVELFFLLVILHSCAVSRSLDLRTSNRSIASTVFCGEPWDETSQIWHCVMSCAFACEHMPAADMCSKDSDIEFSHQSHSWTESSMAWHFFPNKRPRQWYIWSCT